MLMESITILLSCCTNIKALNDETVNHSNITNNINNSLAANQTTHSLACDTCSIFLSLPYNSSLASSSSHEELHVRYRMAETYAAVLAAEQWNEQNGNRSSSSSCTLVDSIIVSDSYRNSASDLISFYTIPGYNDDRQIHLLDDANYNSSGLCGVIGPLDGSRVNELMTTSRSFELPMLTPYAYGRAEDEEVDVSSSLSFNEQNENDHFVRLSADSCQVTEAMLDFLSWQERTYVAVVYDSSSLFSMRLWHCIEQRQQKRLQNQNLENALKENNITIFGVEYDSNAGMLPDHYLNFGYVLERMKADTGFTTIVSLEGQPGRYRDTISTAFELGFLSQDYYWLIVPHELDITVRETFFDSNWQGNERFMSGVLIFDFLEEEGETLAFQWRNNLFDKVSLVLANQFGFELKNQDMLDLASQQKLPSSSQYMYDAVARIMSSKAPCQNFGLQCRIHFIGNEKSAKNNSFAVHNIVDKVLLYEELDEFAATMASSSLSDSIASQSLTIIRLAYFESLDRKWQQFGNFSYINRSPLQPPLRVVEVDMNYVDPGLRHNYIFGSSAFLLYCIAVAVSIERSKDKPLVKEAQTFYLHVLNICSFGIVTALYPLSVDESTNSSIPMNTMCLLVPVIRENLNMIIIYTFWIKLHNISQELISSNQQSYMESFCELWKLIILFSFLVSNTVTTSYSNAFVWERNAIEYDEYGYVVSTEGQCRHYHILGASGVFLVGFVAFFLFSYKLYHRVEKCLVNIDGSTHISQGWNHAKAIFHCLVFQVSVKTVGILLNFFLSTYDDRFWISRVRVIYIAFAAASIHYFVIIPNIWQNESSENVDKVNDSTLVFLDSLLGNLYDVREEDEEI